MNQTEQLADLIKASGSVVALTGAGISVPSGIPDFRSPGTGIWESVDPMEVAHIDVFYNDPEHFWRFYRPRFSMLAQKQPNEAHYALAKFEEQGLLKAVITQNIDTLHSKAGSKKVVEVHGSVVSGHCVDCASHYRFAEAESIFDSNGVARCDGCGGLVKPNVVLFGEMLPSAAINKAFALARSADLLLCVGSSLQVQPVAMLPQATLDAGGQIAIITQGATPYDALTSFKFESDVADELAALAAVVMAA